jgi:Fe-S-cluster containining protein
VENEIVEIAINNSCPCGSGKQFGDCCVSKGHTYALFDYGGVRFPFDLDASTKDITELMDFCFNNIIRLYEKGTDINIATGLRNLGVIYDLLTPILEPFLRNSSCKKGCSECCHLRVDTTAIEADMIQRHVKEHFDHMDKLKLVSRIRENGKYYPEPRTFGEEYPGDLAEGYFQRHIPCPFLSKERACTIYEVRPLLCRTYIVFSNPQQCKFGELKLAYKGEYFPQLDEAVDCLSALVFRDLQHGRHLPDWFLHEFRL